ncbi:nicotinate-nucleotide--dimethylbenzimidazole phosphoribosyltransferase [Streptomyces sp. NPDC057217]|uniref:nicotinate-nucleotide--dimethylbenzimidazole phosphoribosyltransferase n=1 Tax=Streptomyces sp. NPDC057217 TaxID=3346054 RepID=UPI003639C227
MTDTGQVPGEGLPENAGMVERPGIPAPGAYTFLDPSEHTPEDDDLLLMPGAQGAWSEHPPGVVPAPPVAVPPPVLPHQEAPTGDPLTDPLPDPLTDPLPEPAALGDVPYTGTPAHGVPAAPYEPVLTDHGYEPGILDTGSVDLGGVHVPPPAAAQTPPPARRPLHMGPPVPEATGGVVRSLADRGPATAPVPVPQPAPEPLVATGPAPVPVRNPGPPTTGPEYFEIAQEQQLAPQGAEPWTAQEPVAQPPAETVVPQPDHSGQFVQVDGAVPTTPHLAPTPTGEQTPAPEPPAEPAPEPTPAPEEPAAAAEPTPEAAPEIWEEPTAPEAIVVPAPREPEPATPEATEPEPVAPVAEEPTPEPETPAEQPAVEPVAEAAPEQPQETPEAPEEPQEQAQEQALTPEPAPEPFSAQEQVPVQEPTPAQEPAPTPEVLPTPEPAPTQEPTPTPEVLPTPEPAPTPEPILPPEPAPVPEPTPSPEPAPIPEVLPTPEPAPTPEESAQEQVSVPVSTPAAPGYDDAEREAVLRVMRERRDIRNGFRSDPIPHEVLLRVLEAAHTAPSVGHSQPWDFVVIRSAETRQTMHELAQRQREAYARSLPKARAKQFKELKIEAILDTPVNIVVTADPTRGGRHTLGRYTQPQMAPYSSALAVENLWLAARAEGLGVGWVSFFDEREMVRALGLPEHLEVVAYLCVGYVDEFPEEPELMQAGWSKRRPLAWVVHEETYGRRALPGEEPHDLLQETVANIRPLDAKALGEAWERQKRMTKPTGALGMLEIISAQLAGLSRMCPPPIPEPAAVAVFAGDHGVHAQGVTPWPQEVTGQMVANFLGGGAVCNAFANQVGAEVCVVDVGVASELPATPGLLPRKVRPGTADFTTGPAMTREEVLAAIEVGIETARDLVAAGNKALLTGEMGIANTTASAALISVFTDVDPAEVTGRGTGINDETHARKVDVVRRALALHTPDPEDPIGALAAVGGLEHAALVGLILGAASLRTPVILDGVSTGAAALVARAIAPESLAACIAGHRSAEPGHVAALNKLGLRPLVDLDLRLGEGTGALLALPLVQSAARAMHEVATFDSAGVTEK